MQLTLLAKDLLNHKLTTQTNAAQQLLLDLMQHLALTLQQIAHETKVDLAKLDSLLAGHLDTITLTHYKKLLCFYCFKQTQAAPPQSAFAPAKEWHDWHERGGVAPLSIHAKYIPLRKTRGKHNDQARYYLNDALYLTLREFQVALALFNEACTYKAIGKKLELSARTVEYYVANLRIKFKAASRHELKRKLKPFLVNHIEKGKEDDNSNGK